MTEQAFDKILVGLEDALAVAKGEKEPASILARRYCETDLLPEIAWSMFGHLEGWSRVQCGEAACTSGSVRAHDASRRET